MFDSHVHTSTSCDCDMPVQDGINKCRELGVGIVITDHMDINELRGPDFTFDVDTFFEKYLPLRADDVLLGIELGFRVEAAKPNADIVDKYDFDFILGSTHAPYDMVTDLEYYDGPYYDGKSKQEAYNEYFESMLKGIKANTYFDSLAHIDYIARYSPFEDQELYYDEHAKAIDAVLAELVKQDKSMEISTRRIDSESARVELQKIYNRFADLGGKTVTLGSDSHGTSTIAKNFDIAFKIAKEAGLKAVYYRKRERVYI